VGAMGKMSEAERICEGVTGPLRSQAIELAKNMLFLERQLGIERDVIQSKGMHVWITETVGRGGDKHKVLRENKAFTGYNSLLRTYRETVSALDQILAKSQQPTTQADIEQPKSNLEKFRAKYPYKLVVGGS
jgi:hypothetical protein